MVGKLMSQSSNAEVRRAAGLLASRDPLSEADALEVVRGLLLFFDVVGGEPKWSSALLEEAFKAYYARENSERLGLAGIVARLLRASRAETPALQQFIEDVCRLDMVFGRHATYGTELLELSLPRDESDAEIFLRVLLSLRVGFTATQIDPLIRALRSPRFAARISEAITLPNMNGRRG